MNHRENIKLYFYGLGAVLSALALGLCLSQNFNFCEILCILLALSTITFFALLLRGTARYAAEARLKTQKLEENNALLARTNKELEQFAYVASHDLKAPLRHIDNLAQWVIEDTQGMIPADAEEKLHTLRARVKRLDKLLNDILAYSRAGRITGEPMEIDIQKFLKEIAASHLPSGFTLHIASPLPVLYAPPMPLEQIWGNIFSNAVKHHNADKGNIVVTVREEGDYYEFSARDDGPGIPAHFHDRAFEMFQVLQSKDKVEGCGMGLAIIKKLTDYYGGRVWIESNAAERGTNIIFLWPKNLTHNHF